MKKKRAVFNSCVYLKADREWMDRAARAAARLGVSRCSVIRVGTALFLEAVERDPEGAADTLRSRGVPSRRRGLPPRFQDR